MSKEDNRKLMPNVAALFDEMGPLLKGMTKGMKIHAIDLETNYVMKDGKVWKRQSKKS